jgi:hypothetical protein
MVGQPYPHLLHPNVGEVHGEIWKSLCQLCSETLFTNDFGRLVITVFPDRNDGEKNRRMKKK